MKSKNSQVDIQYLKCSTNADWYSGQTENQKDREYIEHYKTETDEELYRYLQDLADELGRIPKKSDVPAYGYIKSRLGNWPRIMEKAGIKPVNEKS